MYLRQQPSVFISYFVIVINIKHYGLYYYFNKLPDNFNEYSF